MSEKFKRFREFASWCSLFGLAILFIVLLFYNINAKKTNETPFIFGYLPAHVRSDSMEPYMLTGGFVLAKKVDSSSDIQIGDVVSFYFTTEAGERVLISHRLIGFHEDGTLITKGDNNPISDDLFLTTEDIEAKIVCVFNLPAHVVHIWQFTVGKIMLLSIFAAFILLVYLIRKYIQISLQKQNIKQRS